MNRKILALAIPSIIANITTPLLGLVDTAIVGHMGNAVYIGYPEQWIEILGHRIKKLHMSDYRFDQAGIGAFVDLFAGDVDFPAVAKAIAGIGYDDYITLEMLPNYKQFPEVSLYADKYAMNKIIEMIHL